MNATVLWIVAIMSLSNVLVGTSRQKLSHKVDSVRIRIMKDVKKTLPNSNTQTDEYYLLKKFNWLIVNAK